MQHVELVIIGGGSAGMSAAIAAHKAGCEEILILERGDELGGILNQCIHNGFGLRLFQKELSGPAFAQALIDDVEVLHIPYELQATVLQVDEQRCVTYISATKGLQSIQAKAVIFACGCFERTRGVIHLPGTRVKGIYTAGSAQRYLNMENVLVGKRVFILGSGDIGLIMARRMRLEGAEVLGVAELMPYSNGLTRNIVQCLDDFEIPLYLSHSVVNIEGKEQLERITIAQVDEQGVPIAGTQTSFDVDTLLLSVGLIPETSLQEEVNIALDPHSKGAVVDEYMQTSIPHVYACGNGLHVHDLVDDVAFEAQHAGKWAYQNLKQEDATEMIPCTPKDNLLYLLPHHIHKHTKLKEITFAMRVRKPMKQVELIIKDGDQELKKIKKAVVLPAEMLRVTIPTKEFIDANTITMEVREV